MRRMRADAEQHGGGSESTYKELTALAYGKIGIAFSLLAALTLLPALLLAFRRAAFASRFLPSGSCSFHRAAPIFAIAAPHRLIASSSVGLAVASYLFRYPPSPSSEKMKPLPMLKNFDPLLFN